MLVHICFPSFTGRSVTAMNFLYGIPAVVLLAGALIVALVAAGSGQIYVHRRFRTRDFIAHNEVGGIIIAVSGTLYAVILGFLTVVVWQHFVEAGQMVVQESDAVVDVWHTSVGLSPPVRERIRDDMTRYQLLMTSTVVTIIVSILVLLFELQYPFRSDVGIGPDNWIGAVEHIHQMQTGTLMNMRH